MRWVSLGPVSVPTSWAAMVLAFLITGAFLFITKKKAALNWYENAIFIFIVTWKLSVIIFHPKMAIANPMTILYFNGGVKGYGIGLAGALLYTTFSKKGAIIRYSELALSWILAVSTYELVYGVFKEIGALVVAIQLIINLALLTLLIIKAPNRLWMLQIITLFTCVQGIFYTLKANLLSLPMATYLIFVIFFYFWSRNRGGQS
ncbi:hypothetical protein [Siminovitchia sp. 179-K 8D1 HS]|uniref:hypothetical protein n=1 Tax=Siminovitchia sp. 179-K 8D1 HS TaxID=3142385 RepID=UPI00399EF58D